MIRALDEPDRPIVEALLQRAPEWTIYYQANIEALGFSAPHCTFWGDFSSNGGLRGVANRFGAGWGIYGQPDADWPALAALVDADPNAKTLQDNPGGVESLEPLLTQWRVRLKYVEQFMRLDAAHFRPALTTVGVRARMAEETDLPALSAYYVDAGTMARSAESTARALRNGGIALVERDGAILAAVLVHARTRQFSMIGGVYTLPAARGHGYSTAAFSVLCAVILDSGRTPLLYWQHADAGAVYRKLGFTPIGTWRSLWLERIHQEG